MPRVPARLDLYLFGEAYLKIIFICFVFRFLSKVTVKRQQLQLVAVSCLLVAWKVSCFKLPVTAGGCILPAGSLEGKLFKLPVTAGCCVLPASSLEGKLFKVPVTAGGCILPAGTVAWRVSSLSCQ